MDINCHRRSIGILAIVADGISITGIVIGFSKGNGALEFVSILSTLIMTGLTYGIYKPEIARIAKIGSDKAREILNLFRNAQENLTQPFQPV